MINFRSITAAMFLATGRIPVGTANPSRCEETSAQTLVRMAQKCDSAQESAMHSATRLQRQLADFINGPTCNGMIRNFDAPNPSTSADVATAVAKFSIACEFYELLFVELSGVRFDDAARVVHLYMPSSAAWLSEEWVAEAAGLIALAKAYRVEEQANYVQKKADEAQHALDAIAKEKLARDEQRAARAADRKVARAYSKVST